jgi:hypothetical protein
MNPIDDTPRRPMSLERLRLILEAYGAHADHWPLSERGAALALLAESSEARTLRDEAARLDAALDLLPAPEMPGDLLSRVLADAPGAGARRRTRHWWRAALALPLAAAAAFLMWVWSGEKPTTTPPPEFAISDLGVYTTPTDVLLVPPGMDLLRSRPTVGCEDDGLGCPDLDVPTERQSSRRDARMFG